MRSTADAVQMKRPRPSAASRTTRAATPPTIRRTLQVSVWPVWQHVCADGAMRTIKLGRGGRGLCAGCHTEAVYAKPAARARGPEPDGHGGMHF